MSAGTSPPRPRRNRTAGVAPHGPRLAVDDPAGLPAPDAGPGPAEAVSGPPHQPVSGLPHQPAGDPPPPGRGLPPLDEPLPDDRFLNRELSWLDFNDRVLQLAEDDSLPLMERVKFLAIIVTNLESSS